MNSNSLESIFECCRNVHKSTCAMTRLLSVYKATVLSFQLVLKMAEIQYEILSKVSHITDNQCLFNFVLKLLLQLGDNLFYLSMKRKKIQRKKAF